MVLNYPFVYSIFSRCAKGIVIFIISASGYSAETNIRQALCF
ncbi:hypothetical protein CUS_6293 [Ruminococcus albus 8]|uniref:Uncharacterized protein n=1 Tax=Ruminococcus albus 8 TaxID=246199 RepID=E9S9I0_RUMAL|nr:hypothetical protein CUS_6293 [Ruminococcus albus 8]